MGVYQYNKLTYDITSRNPKQLSKYLQKILTKIMILTDYQNMNLDKLPTHHILNQMNCALL